MKRRRFLKGVAGLGLASLANKELPAADKRASAAFVVEQFEDKGLAHFSYAVIADKKMIIIDPQRNPQVYYDFANQHQAKIMGVIETHPHADFVSSHLEIHHQHKVPIYASRLTRSKYPATAFDEGDIIRLSDTVGLRAMFTPGHAPDHIAAVLFDNSGDKIVFSGDALFLGDVGRPDLLDFSKESDRQRIHLAGLMYDTVHNKFAKLDDAVIVYPSHGAGSLCGKSIRKAASSTIGYEKQTNYAFESRTKEEFIQLLLSDQPFIPKYFAYDVALNAEGAPALYASLEKISFLPRNFQPASEALIVDTRPPAIFKSSHLKNAINIQASGQFETWLGTLVSPSSAFYLLAADELSLHTAVRRAAAIGYEANIKGAFIYDARNGEQSHAFDANSFDPKAGQYTMIDVRTAKEVRKQPVFAQSINIPLQELPDRLKEIPTGKPVLVYCASGYRSSTGASIVQKEFPSIDVFDLGPQVSHYLNNSTH
jgi:hydroxyacylglutathione hydrolase